MNDWTVSFEHCKLISSAIFQVSLKSLQVYDKYGVSEDPLQLQGQVRELKGHLESQTKVILQMQSLLRHNSLSSDLGFSTPDPSSVREQKGRRTEEQSQEEVKKEGENTEIKDKSSHLSMEKERERAQSRRLSEQLQQTSSGSTSPARSDISDWLLIFSPVSPPNCSPSLPSSVLSLTDWTLWCSHRPGSCLSSASRSRRVASWVPCSGGSWRTWTRPSRSCCRLTKSTATWERWSRSSWTKASAFWTGWRAGSTEVAAVLHKKNTSYFSHRNVWLLFIDNL